MPELPEVETVVNDIRPHILGKRIVDFVLPIDAKKTLEGKLGQFKKNVVGQKIIAVSRRAKYIILELEQGIVSVHLRMTGRLYPQKPKEKDLPYIRAEFVLSGNKKLYFQDVRRFGKIKYWQDYSELDSKLGVEPLTASFQQEFFYGLLQGSNKILKSFLLDQTKIAGLGNIYVDESLWLSRLHPETKTKNLNQKQARLLWQSIRDVLQAGIDNCGTTFDSFYYGAEQIGKYVELLKVFDREGEKCNRCQTKIIKIRVATRGTHLCPKCQKLNS